MKIKLKIILFWIRVVFTHIFYKKYLECKYKFFLKENMIYYLNEVIL